MSLYLAGAPNDSLPTGFGFGLWRNLLAPNRQVARAMIQCA